MEAKWEALVTAALVRISRFLLDLVRTYVAMGLPISAIPDAEEEHAVAIARLDETIEEARRNLPPSPEDSD